MEGLLWTDGAYYIEVRPFTCTQRLWEHVASNHGPEEVREEDGVLSSVSPSRARIGKPVLVNGCILAR